MLMLLWTWSQTVCLSASSLPSGGFLKLSSEEITPINITTPTIMMSGASRGVANHTEGGGGRTENHYDVQRENPFLQFLTNPTCRYSGYTVCITCTYM